MSGTRRRLVAITVLVGVGALTWFALSVPPRAVTWLSVSAPPQAVAGEILHLRVTLRQAFDLAGRPAPKLVVDLHWSNTHKEDRGFLVAAPAKLVAPPGTEIDFPVIVPSREDLGYVHPIIYLSPDGRWEHRLCAAEAGDIPVLPAGTISRPAPLRELRPLGIGTDPGGMPSQSLALRLVIAAGWIVCAVRWWRPAIAPPRQSRLRFAAVVAAGWELSHLDIVIGDFARAVAREHHWYEWRGPAQQIATLGLVLATAAVGWWIGQRTADAGRRRARLGLLLYAVVTIGSLLSLHRVDQLLSQRLLTISLLQILQLAAVAVALTGGARGEAPVKKDGAADS